MRILTGLLAIALLAAWGPVAPAAAQCEPTTCSGLSKGKTAQKTKAAKQAAAKKPKQPKDVYMRVAP